MRGWIVVGVVGMLAACGKSEPSLPVAKALSAEGAKHSGYSWSPDGNRIAWWEPVADSGFDSQLWIANADFTAPMKLPVTGGGFPVTWSPDGTQIAATSDQWGAADVVVVPAAGGTVRRITHGGFQFNGPWNRDGDRLALHETAAGGTYRTSVISVASGKATLLVPHETHPFIGLWSPDGSHVMYIENAGPKSTLWVADSTGEHPRQLTTEGFEGFQWYPSPWSPDGKEVLYESRRTGTSDLWVAPIDGSKPRQLTHDVRNDYGGSWSSDGKWVAFLSDRGRQVDVWVVPSAGGAEHRVTNSAAEEGEPPSFRPGTLELAFVGSTSKSGVWAVEVADGAERRITSDSIRTGGFYVAPDGKQLDLRIERGGGIEDLAVMPLAGGAVRTLVAGGGSVRDPVWSPDGSKIAFASDRAGASDIFMVEVASGALRQVENWPGYEFNPTWAGDGTWLYFLSDRDTRIADVWKVAATGGEPIRVTRDGGVNSLIGRRGVADIFVSTFGRLAGFATSRVAADGSLHPIWDQSNSFPHSISPKGDSILVFVAQPNAKGQEMIFPTHGGRGRILLPSSERAGPWSEDGRSMIYYFRSGGSDRVGVLNLADGSKRPLTHSPDADGGADWTPDGKTILFNRNQNVSRIFAADLSRLLAGPQP